MDPNTFVPTACKDLQNSALEMNTMHIADPMNL